MFLYIDGAGKTACPLEVLDNVDDLNVRLFPSALLYSLPDARGEMKFVMKAAIRAYVRALRSSQREMGEVIATVN